MSKKSSKSQRGRYNSRAYEYAATKPIIKGIAKATDVTEVQARHYIALDFLERFQRMPIQKRKKIFDKYKLHMT